MTGPDCAGFLTGGIAAGIKKNGEMDLGLIFSRTPASVAGVFTRNRVKAAPVMLDRERVQSGTCRAIIVNSGNANCCTGDQGMLDAIDMAALAGEHLSIPEDQVLVASTGVIGQPMPMTRIRETVPQLVRKIAPDGFADFARAIMTTDTVAKVALRTESVEGKPFTLIAAAKGAGMIRPDMATMLCFVCTDAGAKPDTLRDLLTQSTRRTFNRMSIDGDTSTNDTALLLANGASGVCIDHDPARRIFRKMLDDVCKDLARQLIKDGEGVTKLVDIVVRGSASDGDAEKVAETVANSNLVKTAFFGEDANWGRILGAVGRAGVPVMPETIDVFFDTVQMVRDGVGCGHNAETRATEVLRKDEFSVIIDLKMGEATTSVLTCDFSVEYVRINADYRS